MPEMKAPEKPKKWRKKMKRIMSKQEVVQAILNDTEKHVDELNFDEVILDVQADIETPVLPVYYPEITEEIVDNLKQTVKNIHVMHSNRHKANKS